MYVKKIMKTKIRKVKENKRKVKELETDQDWPWKSIKTRIWKGNGERKEKD